MIILKIIIMRVIKTILLGGSCRGKSTIIRTFMSQKENYDRCLDVSFNFKGEKKICLEHKKDIDQQVKDL